MKRFLALVLTLGMTLSLGSVSLAFDGTGGEAFLSGVLVQFEEEQAVVEVTGNNLDLPAVGTEVTFPWDGSSGTQGKEIRVGDPVRVLYFPGSSQEDAQEIDARMVYLDTFSVQGTILSLTEDTALLQPLEEDPLFQQASQVRIPTTDLEGWDAAALEVGDLVEIAYVRGLQDGNPPTLEAVSWNYVPTAVSATVVEVINSTTLVLRPEEGASLPGVEDLFQFENQIAFAYRDPAVGDTITVYYIREPIAGDPPSLQVVRVEGQPFRDCPSDRYSDVSATAWYHQAVDYVTAAGIMQGTSDTKFSPEKATTRGMLVTMLYRLESAPAAEGDLPFTDVAESDWYGSAVLWALQNGLVTGASPTTFAPNSPITREQMATILYRYAQYKGYDEADKADLSGYTDAGRISSYAQDAMAWANGTGLLTGVTATTLNPTGTATRGQTAAILFRLCEGVMA